MRCEALILGLALAGAAAAQEGAGVELSERGWDPVNRRVLDRWLGEVAKREGKRSAVFDFDNTCIFHDCGEATFRFQLDRLHFRITPAQLRELIPAEIQGVAKLRGGESIADVRADLLAAWEELFPRLELGERQQAMGSPAHRDFRARLLWLYEEANATPGIGATWSYPLLAQLLAGYTADEVGTLAVGALRTVEQEAPGKASWETATPGRSGARTVEFVTGIREQPEMIDLIRALQRVGVECWIVSASTEAVVEAVAAELRYPIDAEHIFGVRTVRDEKGVFTPRQVPLAEYPLTWRQGKVDVLRKLGVEPLLVAGDTFTDVEMLTKFPATEVRLLVNRNQVRGELVALYQDGLTAGERAPAPGKPRVILQGRDEPQAKFRPGLLTIPLGEKEPKGIEVGGGR